MHPIFPLQNIFNKIQPFNSLYLGFSLASAIAEVSVSLKKASFQFPLLGIFPCIARHCVLGLSQGTCLSIPFTWDFPLHQELEVLLGETRFGLSIPFTWDFPLHRKNSCEGSRTAEKLSIPFTWDFPLHLQEFFPCSIVRDMRFQFPLLGIFPCINQQNLQRRTKRVDFQFPLLGIFPCICEYARKYG